MLEDFVKTAVRKQMKTEFPHLELPAAMYAKVTKRTELGEYYEYNLKILDEDKQVDDNFPEMPHVKSKQGYEVGDVVAVLMLYGKNSPYIVGEVV
ncbi:hypothetical protein NE686_13335 [Tissierella carlieri]|uniref:Uncharacterized protein n=1 Tax=Tissierella carlieri TaxID=689904 RepID=A0ABT1SC68_9FIRM|nr:hypothetical protein [Tissierella carlieri]MCQ4924079.1 hypothetical protein [Tissierella carlieri]